MADQGWMVDDGTCDACAQGLCYQCVKPCDEYDDEGRFQVCCCNEGYDLGRVEEESR